MSIPPFLVPIAAGLFAQALKPLLNRAWRDEQARRLDPRPRYGGMPSAHTAFAASLATVAGFVDGLSSLTFALSLAILILVLDDALRLRVFLGRFGAAIRRLSGLLSSAEREALPPIEAQIGHRIPEVLVGAAIGIGVTVLLWALDRG